ncbi:Holliday junction resolvase RuvX [Zhihengliuella halotolerans]|uniref:Putative pre-16S rRNA nuclease n=1 Tax=Zhihengliuella halotolerans TaxID=370736 RepID=A0A4V2G9S4_9MICC|nr:Holliday junction resolvase RuvX [Zhihengliuella halotolerans]RZU61476.1 putative Holliday junction resolvase [Zhihengliuella halotolerans]
MTRGVRIGIDVGLARVGVAHSDPDALLASPWKTLKRDVKKNSDLRVLVQYVRDQQAVTVYVGLPRSMNGGETASTTMARDYAAELLARLQTEKLDAEVRLVDERLTTVSAHKSLHAAGVDGRQHRRVVDQVAAVAILQQAIDMEKSLQRDVGTAVESTRNGQTDQD